MVRSCRLPALWLATIGLASSVGGSVARAQPARDDVAWEVRRVPYRGGPIRPGAQLAVVPNSEAIAVGGTTFVISFLVTTILGFGADRPIAIVPLVGPWLGAFGVASDSGWQDSSSPWLVAAALAQAAGLATLVVGIVTPSHELVFDAPVGARSPFEATLRVAPYAPGAELGASLSVEVL